MYEIGNYLYFASEEDWDIHTIRGWENYGYFLKGELFSDEKPKIFPACFHLCYSPVLDANLWRKTTKEEVIQKIKEQIHYYEEMLADITKT